MKLDEEVRFRISKQDVELINDKAKLIGLTVGAYCRMIVLKNINKN
jgi:predicted DNA binding CopG/RHH family protein